jgi:hypothetical protein
LSLSVLGFPVETLIILDLILIEMKEDLCLILGLREVKLWFCVVTEIKKRSDSMGIQVKCSLYLIQSIIWQIHPLKLILKPFSKTCELKSVG